jgi:gamma-glutamylputrescine oxidase
MSESKFHNYSYWELKTYFKRYDLIVIGSGIVGLSTAISYKEKNSSATILILEQGFLPDGASTKNAGFACFGSAGELLDDLRETDADTVWETVQMRWNGLRLLRNRLKDRNIDFRCYGGYELFYNATDFETCRTKLNSLNQSMKENLGIDVCYREVPNPFQSLGPAKGMILNAYEGQLDTGKMMQNLIRKVVAKNILILNNIKVEAINETGISVELMSDRGMFQAARVVVATNGFAAQLTGMKEVQPARAQVLVTSPLKNLDIRGTFHFDKGFYYFRNIHNRILFGGGRNLDISGETSTERVLNEKIQDHLDALLRESILPGIDFKVDLRWSGIMGLGKEKKPIISVVSSNVVAAVRMGGMGIAIGSWVGEKTAELIS